MKKFNIPILVIIACLIMGIVDAVIQPGYIVKSIIKIVLFLLIPLLYSVFAKDRSIFNVMKADKKGFSFALILGIIIYIIILGAYFLFKDIFDFSLLTKSLGETTGVNASNFLWVAIYISFVNSLLEEFFFRGFSFVGLKRVASRKTAYIFSAFMFAAYHIAMMIGWFSLPVVLLSMAGLFAGGIIFNFFNERYNNIYISWLIHMFANFATNTIGFILFAE